MDFDRVTLDRIELSINDCVSVSKATSRLYPVPRSAVLMKWLSCPLLAGTEKLRWYAQLNFGKNTYFLHLLSCSEWRNKISDPGRNWSMSDE